MMKDCLVEDVMNVTRLEVINHALNGKGREYTVYGNFNVGFSVQDGGKTLKIFLKEDV